MKNQRVQNTIFVLLFICFLSGVVFGQNVCTGSKFLTERTCAGDEISDSETKLYQIINEYRKQNNLAPVPISKTLSVLANRHLLDINSNLKKTTHSWSNCDYDLNNNKTWNCVSDAPKRLNVGYEGQGFENLYRNFNGGVDANTALAAWKKSDIHNSLILNLNVWKDRDFDSLGVAIDGQYASIWFGQKNSATQTAQIKPQGLGISYADVVKNLSSLVAINKTSSVTEQQTWNGLSKDKTVALELNGTENDIVNARISLKIKLEKNLAPSGEKRNLMIAFVNNIFGKSAQNESWIDENLTKMNDNSAYRDLFKDNKIIEIRRDSQNNLILTAKPYQKKTYKEIY